MDIPRPARALTLTAKLKDAANTEAPQLSFQRKAVHDFHSRQANKNDPPVPPSSLTVGADANAPSSASAAPTPQTKSKTSSIADIDDDGDDGTVDQLAPCMSSSSHKPTFSFQCALYSQEEARRWCQNSHTGEEKACRVGYNRRFIGLGLGC